MGLRTENDFWELIKSLTWHKFPDRQVYKNEKEHLIILKRKTGEIAIAACAIKKGLGNIDDKEFIAFVESLIKWSSSKWNTCDISIICNFRLSEIWHADIINLPKDVKYFHTEKGQLYQQDLEANIECSIKNYEARYGQKSTYKREKTPIDYESQTISALIRGDAEGFGF